MKKKKEALRCVFCGKIIAVISRKYWKKIKIEKCYCKKCREENLHY